MPGPEASEILPQQEIDDGADDRPLEAPYAAYHHIKNDEHGPVGDAEGSRRRDAQFLQCDDGPGAAEEWGGAEKAQNAGISDVDADRGGAFLVIAHCGEP